MLIPLVRELAEESAAASSRLEVVAQEPRDRPRVAIVVGHERLDRGARLALVPEMRRDIDEAVAFEDVLLHPVREVKLAAHAKVEAIGLAECLDLLGVESTVRRDRIERAVPTADSLDPKNALNVAETARSFLEVGFRHPQRAARSEEGLVELLELLAREPFSSAFAEPIDRAPLESLVERRASDQEPVLEEGRSRNVVLGHEAVAVGDGADRVAELKPTVPEHSDELFDLFLRRFAIAQEEEIDVRVGAELAAPVSANGDQRQMGLAPFHLLEKELPENGIDTVRKTPDDAKRVIAATMSLARHPKKLGDVGLEVLNGTERSGHRNGGRKHERASPARQEEDVRRGRRS